MLGVVDINFKLTNKKTYISQSTIHGWGVFSGQDYKEGEIILESPINLIPIGESLPNSLAYFNFSQEGKMYIILGSPSFLNSSKSPNVTFNINPEEMTIKVKSLQYIKSNTELTLKYM